MGLPNTATKLNYLCSQIQKIWKELNQKVNTVISTNSDGTITLGTMSNPVSRIIMSSEIQASDQFSALSILNAINEVNMIFAQNGSKTATGNTYLGIVPNSDFSVMRDSFGDATSVISSNGEFYARCINGVDTSAELQTFLEIRGIPYTLPPPLDMKKASNDS